MKYRTNHIRRQTGPVDFYKKTICGLKYYRFVIGYYINYIPPHKCAKKPTILEWHWSLQKSWLQWSRGTSIKSERPSDWQYTLAITRFREVVISPLQKTFLLLTHNTSLLMQMVVNQLKPIHAEKQCMRFRGTQQTFFWKWAVNYRKRKLRCF